MANLSITESNAWIVEVVRAAVSWIYSRQKTEARVIHFSVRGEGFCTFNGVFAVGLGTVKIKGKELGVRDIRDRGNGMLEYFGDLVIDDGVFGRQYLTYDIRGSNVIIQPWEDEEITEEYEEMPLE